MPGNAGGGHNTMAASMLEDLGTFSVPVSSEQDEIPHVHGVKPSLMRQHPELEGMPPQWRAPFRVHGARRASIGRRLHDA